MAIKNTNIEKNATLARKPIRLILGTSAVSQTAKIPDSVIPGFAFQICKVEVWALTVTATITVDVLIGAVSVLTGAVTPVAATVTQGTLSSALATVRGTAAEAINLAYTSNGSGAATNAIVTVWLRPVPLNGEVYAV